jgi:uncharacterized membrane protein YvlD (DUF360 family)
VYRKIKENEMNSWLDNGIFALVWVSMMWLADAFLLGNVGTVSFSSLMTGAVVLVVVGLIIEVVRAKRG